MIFPVLLINVPRTVDVDATDTTSLTQRATAVSLGFGGASASNAALQTSTQYIYAHN